MKKENKNKNEKLIFKIIKEVIKIFIIVIVIIIIMVIIFNKNISPIFCPKNNFIIPKIMAVTNKATIILLIVAFTACNTLFCIYNFFLCYNCDSKGNCCYYRNN